MFSKSSIAGKKPRRKHRQPVTAHPLFVPMLALWGAALVGLSVMVLPAVLIDRVAKISALTVLGDLARFALAGLAAMVGAAVFYFIASAMRPKMPAQSGARPARASRHVRPIDPSTDLGSESLDAPAEDDFFDADDFEDDDFEDDDFAGDPDWFEAEDHDGGDAGREYAFESEAEFADQHDSPADAWDEPDHESGIAPEHEPASLLREESNDGPASLLQPRRSRRPRGKKIELVQALGSHLARKAIEARDIASETDPALDVGPGDPFESLPDSGHLDLGAFMEADPPAADEAVAPVGEAEPCDDRLSPPRTQTAIEKLRAVPPHELSLVQMVERFACALHDNQAARRRGPQIVPSAERDAALVEALRALSMFSEKGFKPDAAAPDAQATEASEPGHETEREMRDALSKLQSLRGAA